MPGNKDITYAISIRQPWAELIMRGIKVREIRTVPTNMRGRVYVYAGLQRRPLIEYLEFGLTPQELPSGVLVGTVEVIDCEEHSDCYAYVLANPRRLRQPLKPKNHPQPIWFRPF